MPQPHILVTGATGFIGAKLVANLLRDGHTVRTLVRDATQITAVDGMEVFEGDLTVPSSLAGIDHGIDIVIHCAGLLGKWGCSEATLYKTNVQGSCHLLEAFHGKTLTRFIHVSAGGVTGPLTHTAVDETYRCQPATAYEQTKYRAEQDMLALSKAWGMPTVVVRPTFTYGPGDPHKLALFKAIQRGRYAFIGKGLSVNHPVYIDDVLAGIRLAIEHARVGEVYIIGGPRPVTKRELANTIADVLMVPRPQRSIPRWGAWLAGSILEVLGQRLHFEPVLTRSRVMMMADNFGYSIHKAANELGYQPQTDLPAGIAQTIRYYIDHGLLAQTPGK